MDALVKRGDQVVVLDNLATGKWENILHQRNHIIFHQGDIRDFESVLRAMEGAEYVLHQAALGSVPRSISDPKTTNEVNISGTLNLLVAARDQGVKRFVYAGSSSVYGDTVELPKHEAMPLRPISPYALSKATAEEYSRVFNVVYGLKTTTLRYFNVFGPRQDPNSQYAAAIPKFVAALLDGKSPQIYGDGSASRDFTYVANVVHANLLALGAGNAADGKSFNVGAGGQVGLLELVGTIQQALGTDIELEFLPPRPGEVQHSCASIKAAKEAFGYEPIVGFMDGISETIDSFVQARRVVA